MNKTQAKNRFLFKINERETEPSGYWCTLPQYITILAADVHQTGRLPVPLPPYGVGSLVLGTTSRLDALSVYSIHGRLSSDATRRYNWLTVAVSSLVLAY